MIFPQSRYLTKFIVSGMSFLRGAGLKANQRAVGYSPQLPSPSPPPLPHHSIHATLSMSFQAGSCCISQGTELGNTTNALRCQQPTSHSLVLQKLAISEEVSRSAAAWFNCVLWPKCAGHPIRQKDLTLKKNRRTDSTACPLSSTCSHHAMHTRTHASAYTRIHTWTHNIDKYFFKKWK